MQILSCVVLALLLAQAPSSFGQDIATVVVYVTVPLLSPSSSTITSEQAILKEKNTLTAGTHSAIETGTSSTSSTSFPSIIQANPSSTPSSMSSEYNAAGAQTSGGNSVDTEAGASGSDNSSFHLSTGALVAIIIIVVLVALFGIASIVLFLVAKRRSWTVRQTISRASRRLTGRAVESRGVVAANRQSRRAGVRMGSPPRSGVRAVYPPGHKRGFVMNMQDPEKGPHPLDGRASVNTRPREKSWAQKLWNGQWK